MDEEEIDLDQLDNMFDDLSGDDESIETDDIDTGSRNPVDSVLKSTKKVLNEKMSVESGLEIIGDTADRVLPDDLKESKDSLKKAKDEILEPIKEEVGNLKGNARTFFGGAAEMAGEDSFFGNMLGKVRDMLSDDDDGDSSREESEDEKIANNVNDILSTLVDQQQAGESYNAKISEMQGKTQEELLARVVSNLEIMKDHELNIVNSYNRKILELDYKKVFLLDKTFNLLKESTELTGKQLEAINKNTSLPDIVKTRNSEHMEKMFKDKIGKAGLDFLSKNDAVSNITNAIKDKANDVIGNVAQGLDAGNMLLDSAQMTAEMGLSGTDMLMGQVVDGVINKVSDKAGKAMMNTLLKTTLGKEGSSLMNKYGSDIKYGAEDLKEILENRDTPIDPRLEKLLDFISESAGSSYGADIDLQSDNPDDVTIFDNKAKKSITTVIPTLLSKILNEVTGIRTGEKPKEEMVYDYYSNKFTNTTALKREMIHTLNQSNKSVAKDLDSSNLFTVLESKNKLTKEERKIVKDKLYKFISNGGTTSPYFLERAGFLEEFKPELAGKLKENIDTVLNDKGRFSQNLLKEFQDSMERIKGSVNSSVSLISSKANKLSMLGRTDILEELKLTDSKDHTKIKSENITDINSRLISKHTDGSVNLESSDLTRSERTQALEIRKDIEKAVRGVKDKDLQGKVKSEVLKKIRKLDIKTFLDLGNVTRNITSLRKFMFDMYKDRLVVKKKEDSWLDDKIPEPLKNAKNNIKKGFGAIFNPIEKNIEKTINETLGVEEDNKIIVDWDEDELDSEKSKVKTKKHFLNTKKKRKENKEDSDRKDEVIINNSGFDFNCEECMNPTNKLLESIKNINENVLDKITVISENILDFFNKNNINDLKSDSDESGLKDAGPIMEKVKDKKDKELDEVLSKLDKFSKGGATDPNKGIDEVAGVVHGQEYVINNKKLDDLIDTTKDLLSFTKDKDGVKVDNENAFDLFTNGVKDLIKSGKEGFTTVANKVSEMSTPDDYEERMKKQTFSDMGKSKIDKQLNKITNNFGDITAEERITTFIKNVFSKDNKDSIVSTINNAFDSKNEDSIVSKINNAFDTNNENSIVSKISNAFDSKNEDSIINKMATSVEGLFKNVVMPRDLKTAKEMMDSGLDKSKELANDVFEESKDFYNDKVKNSNIFKEGKDFIDNVELPDFITSKFSNNKVNLNNLKPIEKIDSNNIDNVKWLESKTEIEKIAELVSEKINLKTMSKSIENVVDKINIFKKKESNNEEMLDLKIPNENIDENIDIDNIAPDSDIDSDIDNVNVENESNYLNSVLEEHREQIKEKGLTEYLKELLSTSKIPDDEEAVPFYTRFLTAIDPRGYILKKLRASGDFLKTMLGLHMSGIANAGKYLANAGKAIKDFGVEKAKGIGGFIKNLIPPQLRFIFDNTLVGRLTKSIGKRFGGIGKGLSNIVTANIKAIKDSAKESFTDKDGNVKINLLRGAKFLGKSFINTAKATAVGDHKKKFLSLDENESVFGNHIKNVKDSARESFLKKDGSLSLNPLNALKFAGKTMYRGIREDLVKNKNDGGIRGVYKDAGAIGVDVAKTGLSILGRISGLEKHIPIIRRDLIVENAPIPERVKAMYFNKEIEFETIKRYIPKKDRKKYYQYLKDFKKEIDKNKKGLFSKTLKGSFKATKGLAENIVRPGVETAAKGGFQAAKGLFKGFSKVVGVDEVTDVAKAGFDFTKKTSGTIKKAGDTVKDSVKVKNVKDSVSKITGMDEVTSGVKDIFKSIKEYTNNLKSNDEKSENTVASKIDKLIDIMKPKKNKFNDKDGDGRRDGSYLDRLKMFGKKDNKDKSKMKTILEKTKDSSGILTAIMMGMGFLLGGIKTFFKDGFLPAMGKVFKNIIWEPIKWLGSKVLDLGKSIISGIGSSIKDMAGNLLSKIPGFETAKNLVTSVKDKVSGAASWVSDKFTNAKNFIKDGVKTVADKGKKLINKVVSKSVASKLLAIATKSGDMAKLAGKFVIQAGKRIPLVGMVIGGGMAAYHAAKGEWGQAGVDLASGVASTVPFAGIPLSLAVDHYGSKLVKTKKEKPITQKEVLDEIKVDAPVNKPQLLSDLMRDEGLRLNKYKDSEGYDTIGVGHLVDKNKGIPLSKIIGEDKDKITQPEALKILAYDTNRTMKDLYSKVKWLKEKPEPVQRDMVNMGFNLGVPGLLKFKKAMKAIEKDDYDNAAKELVDSKWYKQVGPRASRIVNNLENISTTNSIPEKNTEISPANNVSYKTLDKITKPTDKVKEISSNVEKDRKRFKEHNLLTKDNKIKEIGNVEKDSSIILAKAVDSNKKYVEKAIKEKSKDGTEEILMKSLSVQTEMLNTLQGIYEMNKIMVENISDNKNKEDIDKRINEVDKNSKPKFREGNIPSAFNMRTGTF